MWSQGSLRFVDNLYFFGYFLTKSALVMSPLNELDFLNDEDDFMFESNIEGISVFI